MRYQIENKIAGEGGYGTISKAIDTELSRTVAIKTLDPLFKSEPSSQDVERFRREAKILASLSHPFIPSIYDVLFNQDANEFKIIFQWLEGITLTQYLIAQGVPDVNSVIKWIENICSALDHAHKKGVLHRDIKLSNIIINSDTGCCHLVDFGISLSAAIATRLTGSTGIGTQGYMSPEQEKGEDLTNASDVYSLGIILYELFAGNKPAPGKYVALSGINESIPPKVDELIVMALSPNPNERPQSAMEFYANLRSAFEFNAEFSNVIADGALYEIQTSLSSMSPNEYAKLTTGQRSLIASKIKSLINAGDQRMQNAIASLLTAIIKICHAANDNKFEFFAENSLEYGYEHQYAENYRGNIELRRAINAAIRFLNADQCAIYAKCCTKLTRRDSLRSKETWYLFDLREFCSQILANHVCPDFITDEMTENYEKLSDIINKNKSLNRR